MLMSQQHKYRKIASEVFKNMNTISVFKKEFVKEVKQYKDKKFRGLRRVNKIEEKFNFFSVLLTDIFFSVLLTDIFFFSSFNRYIFFQFF